MTLNTRTRLHTILVQASQLSFGLLPRNGACKRSVRFNHVPQF
jgi:hypothetical protein